MRHHEDELHTKIAKALPLILHPSVVWWSNESRGVGAREGKRRKARGVRAGVPDMEFHYCYAHGDYPMSCFIELKAPKGTMSDAQKALHAELRAIGHRVFVCRSLDDVLDALLDAGCPFHISNLEPVK